MFGSYQMGLINAEKRASDPSYQASGAFSVDWLQPLPTAADLPIPPLALLLDCVGVKLAKMDGGITGKSDPFFEVWVRSDASKPFQMYYRSEVKMKTLNPTWHPWLLNLRDCGGLDSAVQVHAFDFDEDGSHDIIGIVETTPREWLYGTYTHPLINEEKRRSSASYQTSGGFKIVAVTPTPLERPPLVICEAYRVFLGGFKLARKDGPLSKSDPFFRILVRPPGAKKAKTILLYRSEVIKQSLNCTWQPFVIRTAELGGVNTPFTVEVYDWDADGGHDLIGVAKLPLFQWLFGSYRVPLFKTAKGGGISQGALSLEMLEPVEQTLSPVVAPRYSIKCSAVKVAKPGLVDKPDPFFELRTVKGKTLFRSEWVGKSSSPSWDAFYINLFDLCKGNLDRHFVVACFDYSRSGEHTLLGEADLNFRDLMFGSWQFALKHQSRSGSQGGFSFDAVVAAPAGVGPMPPPLAFKLAIAGAKVRQRGLPPRCSPYFRIIDPRGRTIYRSEVIQNHTDPEWKPFAICLRDLTQRGEYHAKDTFSVELLNFDVDTGLHESYGRVLIPLRELTYRFYSAPVYGSENSSNGSINIDSAQALLEEAELPPIFPAYRIQVGAAKLSKIDIVADPQTFFEINATVPGLSRPITLYRSQPTPEKTVNPTWPGFDLPTDVIGGIDAVLEIAVYEFRSDGRELIGSTSMSLREMLLGPYAAAVMKGGSARGIFVVSSVSPLTSASAAPQPAPAYKITASGLKLAKKDGTIIKSSSDPFLEVLCKPPGAPRTVVYYRSEWHKANLNPTWASFVLNTADVEGFDNAFQIRVLDYDEDGAHDLIGSADITLRELALGPPFRLSLERSDRTGSQGALNFDTVEPLPLTAVRTIAPAYEFTVSGTQLAAKDTFGKSDPFFELIAIPPGFSHPITYYRSEHIAQTLDPCWKAFAVNLRDVGGLDVEFTIRVFDRDEDGGHDLIGECKTTLRDWIMGSYSLSLHSPGQAKSQGAFNIDSARLLPAERELVFASSRNSSFELTCAGSKISNQNGIIKTESSATDIFFSISAHLPDSSGEVTIFRSERVPFGKGDPVFRPFRVTLRDLRGLDSAFTVSLHQWQDNGEHIYLGSFSTSFREVCHVMVTGDSLLGACKPGPQGKSNGGFAFTAVRPIPPQETVPFAPAYQFVFSGIKLEAMDRGKLGVAASSDPFFVCRAHPPGTASTITVFRSEVIQKNLNPCWKPFILTLKQLKSIDTEISIEVFDEDDDGDHDLIGSYVTTLRELILGAWRFPLKRRATMGSKVAGVLSIDTVLPVSDLSIVPKIASAYAIQSSGKKIASLDPGSLSDPFFYVFGRRQNASDYQLLYRSEFIKDTAAPKWHPWNFNVDDVGGLDQLIKIEAWDSDPDGQHDFIGRFSTTLREILTGPFIFALKPSGPESKSAGGFVIETCTPLAGPIVFPRPVPAVFKLKPSGFKLLKKSATFLASPGAKCNPFFEIWAKQGTRQLQYRSEIARDTSDPSWNTLSLSVQGDLGGSAHQPFTVIVWNWKETGAHEEIGSTEFKLADCSENDFVLALAMGSETGRGGFSCARLPDNSPTVCSPPSAALSAPAFLVQACGRKIAKKDGGLLAKKDSDPFFRIMSSNGRCLFRSAYIPKTSNPDWVAFPVALSDLPGRSVDDPITIEVYDFDPDGGMDLCGRETSTLRTLLHGLPYRLGLFGADGKPGGGFEIVNVDPIAQPQSNPLLNPPPALELQTSLRKMKRDKLRFGAPPDLFVELTATPPGFDREIVLWRSEVINQKLVEDADSIDSSLAPFVVNVADVRGVDHPFTLTVFEFSKGGDHDVVGAISTTLREWFFGPYVHAIWHSNSSKVSRGAFSVDRVLPLAQPRANINYAPAYQVQPIGFALQRLDGVLRKSNPFFEIYLRLPGYTEETLYYRSVVVKDTDEPRWQPFWLVAEDVGGLDNPFRIVVWDYHPSGLHLEIGSMYATVRQLCAAPWRFAIQNGSKRSLIAKCSLLAS